MQSPGSKSSRGKWSRTWRTTQGIDPRCPGEKLPWATSLARASKSPVEKSSPSRTAAE